MRSPGKVTAAIVATAIVVGAVFLWLGRPRPVPPRLNLVLIRTDAPAGREAIIHFTNECSSRLRWSLQTLVMSNGVWRRARQQPQIEHAAATLPSHGSWNHAVPVPEESPCWKVELLCQRRDTALEDAVESALKRFGFKSPFGSDSKRPILRTTLEFGR